MTENKDYVILSVSGSDYCDEEYPSQYKYSIENIDQLGVYIVRLNDNEAKQFNIAHEGKYVLVEIIRSETARKLVDNAIVLAKEKVERAREAAIKRKRVAAERDAKRKAKKEKEELEKFEELKKKFG